MVWPSPAGNRVEEQREPRRVVSSSPSSSSSHLFAPSQHSSLGRQVPPRPHSHKQQQQQHRDASPKTTATFANLPPSWLHGQPQSGPFQDDTQSFCPPSSSSNSQSTSSIPSTALPEDYHYTSMPGSYSNARSISPTQDEEDVWALLHDPAPSGSTSPLTSPHSPHLSSSTSSNPYSQPSIPSAQHPISYFALSPPPFTGITAMSTQGSSIPSPPSSQYDRPWTAISNADSQPTLREFQHSTTSPPASPVRYHQRNREARRRDISTEDAELRAMEAVVDGIGRMNVTMRMDEAGRWRIGGRDRSPIRY